MDKIFEAGDESIQHAAVALGELQLSTQLEPRPSRRLEPTTELEGERVSLRPLADRDAVSVFDVEVVGAHGVNRQLIRSWVEHHPGVAAV